MLGAIWLGAFSNISSLKLAVKTFNSYRAYCNDKRKIHIHTEHALLYS